MALDVSGIWDALAGVEDPELPVAITDLGLVRSVTVEGTHVRVQLVPTFTGCPALDVIRERVRGRLLGLPGVETAEVVFTYEEPWTLDRLTETARVRLADHGLRVPRASLAEPAVCPFCGSTNTVIENPFGATLCRAIYYCRDCRNPIERFKPPGDSLPAPKD
jgi:ring-1,2-phenylacetyl-CoA epoxidase subunit PaaD